MSPSVKPANLVWIDCEMTGLDDSMHRIIEIACIVTDSQLNILTHTEFDVIVHQPQEVMDCASQWCKDNLDPTLLAAVHESTISTAQAEQQLIEYIRPYITPGSSPLCGNSVHADKRFLVREFPAFCQLLHYRIIDVSTVKELTARWLPGVYSRAPVKQGKHRALDDIRESIAELKYYKQHVFVQQDEAP